MKRRYKIEVSTDNNGWVSVRIPALPNIHAEAHTREQAIQFASSTVQSYLQSLLASGKDIPDSDIDAIVVDL